MPHSLKAVVRDGHSTTFFEAAAEGRLLLRFSPSSGEWSEPAARVCSVTQAADLEWREASGVGSLVSWTVKPGRATEDRPAVPTVVGLVELEEGPWLPLQLPDVDPADLAVGRAVRVEWVQPEGSEHLPVAVLA
ncbi:Zn-ribbon domain-containing OB-fold protein [Nocardioides deserti]|uniref:OB-fold domain-containing protein n=1 Tax=Nocardioides deserti TaxID=1588644 RepID=A0ABR6U6I6_9ACTN|nr:OB-fold domain-containing protein [Nocardioides deserti]MBC2960047.1 OB-fold domain-containing protein [Nocardioides deserti]GGO75089.1 acyl dehydratase [Nocardioides deserti]